MKPELILCLALILSGGLVYGGETTADSSTNSFLRATLSRLSNKVPELSVENVSQGAPYATNTVSASYTNSSGIRLEIIAEAYNSEEAAKNGQESDARMISVNADKMETIKGVKVYEYTRYGGLYFQKGFYTFRFETFRGRNKDLQHLLLKVCSALISEFDSDASRAAVGS
jgi:hypothetical protein